MKPFRIAAVTMNGLLGRAKENLEAIGRWTQKAAEAGAQLVLFPELAVTGHCDPETAANAEALPAGPATQQMLRLARTCGIHICAGLAERDGDAVYNSQIVAGPGGYLGAQRKIHLSRDEGNHFQPGEEVRVFDLGFCRAGIGICYDNWSPEVPRLLAIHGAELLLMPHASRMRMWTDSPDSERAAARHAHSFFRRVMAARAYENSCWVVVVNQAGRAGMLDCYPADHANQPHHAGGCMVFDPFGEAVAELPADRIEEALLVADLDPRTLEDARAHPNCTLRSRRPEVYGDLARIPPHARVPGED
jgi:predicted amidohydrolase